MQPNSYPVNVVTQQIGQPVVMSYPTQQIITQPVMPAVQTVGYIQAPPVQHQIVQHQATTAPVQSRPVQEATPAVARNYVVTAPGIFKIIEFFSLLIAWSCALRYMKMFSDFNLDATLRFFLVVSVLAWQLVILFFLLNMACCHKQCKGIVAATIGAVINSFLTVMLLVASGLLADVASSWQPSYKYLTPQSKEYVNNLYAAVGFGFFSAFLFLIDVILFCVNKNANRVTPPPASAGNSGSPGHK